MSGTELKPKPSLTKLLAQLIDIERKLLNAGTFELRPLIIEHMNVNRAILFEIAKKLEC